ncbi:MAG: hypothetical protein J6R88_02285 [Clostridia bacterium]|nr:hypothetical protein [Clostridia bacterium]
MKKLFTLLLTLMVALTCTLISACKKEPLVVKESDTYVVINVENATENQTLAGYMLSLTEYQDMFVIENGMVTSINGLSNSDETYSYWMIYTNDYSEDVSNEAYGTIDYNGTIYYSAAWGAESLVVKNGYSYIFIYQTFSL